MRVLVTGGAGFIGSHIVDALIARGHTVAVLDDLSSGRRENLHPGAEFCHVDLSVIGFLAADYEPDVICHQAAQASLLRSVAEPIFDATVNILGTLHVIEAAHQCGAHVVMASTSAVYDEMARQPYLEDSPKHPTRPYAVAKLAAEMYLRESGVAACVLRYGNVYGPRQVPVGENQLVPRALAHICDGSPFVLNGDGGQTRDFVYVGDVASANVLAIEERLTGAFNVATGAGTRVNTVLELLARLTHYDGLWQHGPAKPNEPRSVALDPARIGQYGWRPETPLADGLAHTVVAWGLAEMAV